MKNESPAPQRHPRTTRLSACPLRRRQRGVTLVEAMVALFLLSGVMLGIFGTFIASRKVTEESLYHAAASSFIYGLVEQLKTIPYDRSNDNEPNRLPAFEASDASAQGATAQQPTAPVLPYVMLRLNESESYWFETTWNAAPLDDDVGDAPLTIPALSASAASINARDNIVTLALPNNQQLRITIWLWIDRLRKTGANNLPLDEARRITLIYTYTVPGTPPRTVRDREVILRTGF